MINTEEREALMGFPKDHTKGLDTDTREQLPGNAFHPRVLARLLADLPWEAVHLPVTQGGMGLIVVGQDMGATRRAIAWAQDVMVRTEGSTARLLWALEEAPAKGCL